MSFMVVQCAWCGETYTFGVVGTQMIGSGHDCRVTVDCIEEGCQRAALLHVADALGPDGYENERLVCPKHVGKGIVIGCQARRDV